MCRIRELVACGKWPQLARYFWSTCNVAVGLLAVSLIRFHLVLSAVLGRHPVLGNVTPVLHLLTTAFVPFHGTADDLEILLSATPDRYLSTMRRCTWVVSPFAGSAAESKQDGIFRKKENPEGKAGSWSQSLQWWQVYCMIVSFGREFINDWWTPSTVWAMAL